MADSKLADLTEDTAPASNDWLYKVNNGGTTDRKVKLATVSGVIAETVLGSAAASVTFSSIPSSYRHLQVVVYGRGTTAAQAVSLNLRFNSDTAANYSYQYNQTFGAARDAAYTSGATSMLVGYMPAASATADYAGTKVLYIPSYAATTFQKAVDAIGGYHYISTVGPVEQWGGWWANTAAVTSITLFLGTGDFTAGTIATLYGLRGA